MQSLRNRFIQKINLDFEMDNYNYSILVVLKYELNAIKTVQIHHENLSLWTSHLDNPLIHQLIHWSDVVEHNLSNHDFEVLNVLFMFSLVISRARISIS